jgi:hypothetical protein
MKLIDALIVVVAIFLFVLVLMHLSINPPYQEQITFESSWNYGWIGVDYQNDRDVYYFSSSFEEWNSQFEKEEWYNESRCFKPDFEKYHYVYAFWEEKPSSAYSINITMITIDNKNNLYVYIKKTTHGQAGLTVMTYPDNFVQIPIDQFDALINNAYFIDTEVHTS